MTSIEMLAVSPYTDRILAAVQRKDCADPLYQILQDYARAVAEHNVAARDAQIAQLEKANEQLHAHGERMHAEIEALRKERDRAVEAGEIMARHLDTLEPRAERLAGLLDEVRSHFTRDDDLPDDLLPRIDAALAAQQPPAEAQRCTCPSGDGSLRWPCPAHPPEAQPVYVGVDLEGGWIRATTPPSAPVGVAADILRIVDTAIDVCNDRDRPAMAEDLEAVRLYVEQASAPLAQQPAAVTEEMVERATMALLGKSHDPAPGIDWRCDRAWTVNKVRKHMRAALTAALAAQQGGRSDDR